MKGERWLGVVALVSSVLAVGACGDDDEGGGSGGTSSGGSTSGGSAGTTSGGSAGTGGGSGGATGGSAGTGGAGGDATVEAASCTPAALPDAWSAPAYKSMKAPSSACTQAMIKDYATKCSGTNAPPCSAFQADGDASLAACEACLWSKTSDTSWSALIQGTGSASLNVAGCYQLLGGEGAADCAFAYYQLEQCHAEVCKACSAATLAGCEASADTGACKSYADASQTACQPFASSDCAGGGQKAKQALFTAVCGVAGDGGASDAGTESSADAADASGG